MTWHIPGGAGSGIRSEMLGHGLSLAADEGAGSCYLPPATRGAAVTTAEQAVQCARLIDAGARLRQRPARRA
ncbi:MAG: hypothetical protein NTW21_18460 [Verrucomicrobia bacterium]|nr:hypothetical protein [Verrucomicrobiota bacterium]